MSRFSKDSGKKETPAISTASLPDIIFMLLFFFMVVTVMRETNPILRIQIPQATELSKIELKESVGYILIGTPTDEATFGSAPRVQLNDAFAEVDNVQAWVKSTYAAVPDAYKGIFTVSLKVDEEVTMGIVTDVKQELRKADALKINYAANRKVVEE
ncbi:MAG: biopolymer transport protein ExbD [Chitinophagales bacterium]|jgi:biopolymer transport protein ExbD